MGLPGLGGSNPLEKLMKPLEKIGKLVKSLPNPLDLLTGAGEGAKGGDEGG